MIGWRTLLLVVLIGVTMSSSQPVRSQEPGNVRYRLNLLPAAGTDGSVGGALYTSEADGLFYVAGSATLVSGDVHAALWVNGQFQDLGTLGGSASQATGVIPGPTGPLVVGVSSVQSGEFRAFTWSGAMSELLPNPHNAQTRAFGISSAGEPVGAYFLNPPGEHGIIWSGGSHLDLPPVGNVGASQAFAKDGDFTVGYTSTNLSPFVACLWDFNRNPTALGTLGGVQSSALDVVGAGLVPLTVVGYSDLANGDRHAFRFSQGQMVDLGTLGGTHSRANGINAIGEIVGNARLANNAQRACIWRQDTANDLNTLLLSNPSGAVLTDARAIDNRGYITGVCVAGGQNRAYILTPVVAGSPVISGVTPNSGRPGQRMNVTIQGSNFIQAATVNFGPGITVNSAAVATPQRGPTPQSSHLVLCNITIASNATPGPRSVKVTNPGGLVDTYLSGFTVEAPPPGPRLAGFSLTPAEVVGGVKVAGTVILTQPAPAPNARVTFTSNSKTVRAPAPVVLKRGATQRSFKFKTQRVAARTTVTYTGSYGGASISTTLTLLPRP